MTARTHVSQNMGGDFQQPHQGQLACNSKLCAIAIYESLLDGLEIEELREHEGVDIKHYLIVDAHDTWWKLGKSYLCRIIDMLHMGYMDEVLFGREVIERLPELVNKWVEMYHLQKDS